MGHVNWLTNSAYVYVILRIRTAQYTLAAAQNNLDGRRNRHINVQSNDSNGCWLHPDSGFSDGLATPTPLLPTASPGAAQRNTVATGPRPVPRLVPRPVPRPGPGPVPIADSKFSELSCVPQIQSGGMEKALALGRALTSPLAVPVRYSPKGPEANRMRTQSVCLSPCLSVCVLVTLPAPPSLLPSHQQSNRI